MPSRVLQAIKATDVISGIVTTRLTLNAIVNKGTGAGGSNTNRTGLSYEEKTDLTTEFEKVRETHSNCNIIKFKGFRQNLILANKAKLSKYMKKDKQMNINIKPAHGCKCPDEAFIDKSNKKLYIIEKKFQQCSGSVCEKIQTAHFKRIHYNKLYPNYDVIYCYCLSNWFKENCEAELEYLEEINIPVFWGDDIDYKSKVIKFMLDNYL
jgi:hypothetical protein